MKEETRKKIVAPFYILIALLVLAAVDRAVGAFAGNGAVNGPRGILSACWHHAKCSVKFCDEDGRCPVWSDKYSKCYMLDSDGVNVLDMYVKFGCTRKEYEKREFCF